MSLLLKRKKTMHPIHEVVRVLKYRDYETGRVMQQLREPYEIDGVPDGYFCVIKGRIVCPKKRGEKVLVCYSSVFEEEV